MTDWLKPPRPWAIAHRGASAYAPDNTLEAFAVAADLGAGFWEVDVRRTADGVLVAHHDAATARGARLDATGYAALAAETAADDRRMPTLDDVLALAVRRDVGIYADVKDPGAAVPTARALRDHGIERGVIGAFDPAALAGLAAEPRRYPRAVLVPVGADPFAHAAGADIVHLCWERLERPQDALTPGFLARAEAAGQAIALWHEEDPARMAALRDKPIFGICSDTPELVHPLRAPADWPLRIVAHRGANRIAPENTLAAARCAFAAGADIVEVDVHQLADGALAVIHDGTLDRTTDGAGPVAARTHAGIAGLDAGSWFSAHYAGARVPLLRDMLALARSFDRGLYVEIKEADPAAVLAEVARAGMLERTFFWDHRPERLRALRALAPTARIMARRQDFPDLAATLSAHGGPGLVEYAPGDDWAELDRVRAAGLPVMICYMGDDPSTIDRVIAARPDLVNIDHLFLLRDRLRAAGLVP